MCATREKVLGAPIYSAETRRMRGVIARLRACHAGGGISCKVKKKKKKKIGGRVDRFEFRGSSSRSRFPCFSSMRFESVGGNVVTCLREKG